MGIEALKTKALLFASLHDEKASQAATEYMELAVPYDKAKLEAEKLEKEMLANRFAASAPIKAGSIRIAGLGSIDHEERMREAQSGGQQGPLSTLSSMRRR